MFTFEKPPGVNFTLLMPEWPYYFMVILFLGLIFYTLLMLLSLVPQKNKKFIVISMMKILVNITGS
jgi:hypothetical protein